ncbi:MAG: hypothetical protein ACI89X_001420 [Planctomycetota bacterium]|jgi:hypothetical protein
MPKQTMPEPKPRIALLVDRPGWAYDRAAHALKNALEDQFSFEILYVVDQPSAPKCDLLHVFFWGETWHQQWTFPREKIVKEISSHRWNQPAYGNLTPPEFAARHLADAGTLTATSRRLQRILAPIRTTLFCPNGAEHPAPPSSSSRDIRFGWAGNAQDPCKGLHDILRPAAGNDFEVLVAGGELTAAQMPAFYMATDALLIASTAEGEPLTLLEAMAHGCFPIATDVGIVPELVEHGVNGLIVDRTPAAFRAAMQWAACNPDHVRAAGRKNANHIVATRLWQHVAPQWATAWRTALSACRADAENLSEFNNGVELGQWPERAKQAATLLQAINLPTGSRLLDLGCGNQTVRAMLPNGIDYRPFDRIQRTPDTTVLDLATGLPSIDGDAITILGVLEYLPDPRRVLQWASQNCRHLVLSYNDCRDPHRRAQQHWNSTMGLDDVEHEILRSGGVMHSLQEIGRDERLYHISFQPRDVLVPAQPHATQPGTGIASCQNSNAPIALFTAGVAGDNSGDALIEHAIRTLLPQQEFVRLPLVQTLTDAEIERANACRMGLLCGTNLYQNVFAGGLDLPTLRRLRIPIVPLGVGGSTAVGESIQMDARGIAIVREIHSRCEVAGARDPQAYHFVRSLGIQNVELTGCPVLFHNVSAPNFAPRSGQVALALRKRLLHVPEIQASKSETILEHLCIAESPLLVLQSPYDLPQAQQLADRHHLQVCADPQWQADALLAALPHVRASIGLRLHWNMLCLAHGIPAVLLGTDTRTSSFCDLMGLPFHAIDSCTTGTLLQQLHQDFDATRFLHRWHLLRRSMDAMLQANGLKTVWQQPNEVVT